MTRMPNGRKPPQRGKVASGFRITNLWAFVVIDDNDTEGVIGMKMGDGWMPFVCSDQARMQSLRPRAQAIATAYGKTVQVRRFTTGVIVEEIKPQT